MDRGKRLAVLLKIRDGLQEVLRSAIKEDEVAPEKRSEVLSRLASIQREIESLRKPGEWRTIVTQRDSAHVASRWATNHSERASGVTFVVAKRIAKA